MNKFIKLPPWAGKVGKCTGYAWGGGGGKAGMLKLQFDWDISILKNTSLDRNQKMFEISLEILAGKCDE